MAGFPAINYDWRKGARKMGECNLQTHADDLDWVIKYFREKGVKKIFVVGHSMGGPSVLSSKDQDFKATVLWDPSFYPEKITGTKFIKELDAYVESWGYQIVVGKKMMKNFTTTDSLSLVKKFFVPIKVIVAGAGELVQKGGRYFESANNPKEFMVIERAGHNFNEEGTEEILFVQTLKWFKKYSS